MKKNLKQKHLNLFSALLSYMGIAEKITFAEIEKTANYLETDNDEALSEVLSCFIGKRVDIAYNDEGISVSFDGVTAQDIIDGLGWDNSIWGGTEKYPLFI